ncbi:phage tail spike protein [Terrisporobacter petrolearius]|uniref:phage tail spike protein n=1 Tax=Terrisporobacter petrolearius TaxID=1460447 RepID=UPI003AFF63B1
MSNQICDTIFVMDTEFNVIGMLSNNGAFPNAPFFDDVYTSELATGAETYEFSTHSNPIISEILELGNYIVFKYGDIYKLFQIMDNDDEHKEGQIITCYCEMAGLELLTDYCEPFSIEGNVELFFNTVLQDTNWSLGGYSSSLITNIQQVKNEKYNNVYKLIQENIETYGNIEIEFRVDFNGNTVTGFFIDVYENSYRGDKTYKRFEYGENVEGIKRNRNMYDFASAMIGTGKDGLTFKDIEWRKADGKPADKPKGQDFIVDLGANERFNKRGKYIKSLYESEDTNPQDLLLHSWEKLQEVKEPKFDYEVDLALTDAEFEDISIGDTVYVIDNDYNPPILLECRVGKLEISLTDSKKNKCTLSNYKEIVGKIRQDISEDKINEIINTYFPIGGDKIEQGAIGNGHINTTYYEFIKTDIVQASVADVQVLISNKANITDLNATNASIESLKSNKANIEDLNATNATVNNLKSDKASVSELNAVKAQIGTLEAGEIVSDKLHAQDANIKNLTSNKANISDLNATNATVGNLNADVGKINTLLAGNIASSNIQAGGITSDRLTIQNGFIANAMIGSVDAGKINTGTLDTNRVNVQSESGNLLIQDNTIQIRDKTRVRVQIGKDGANDYSMSVWDTQGNIMFDARGMTQDAIKSEIIRNDMVSPNANINGSKLNINSVINEVNEKGTTTLKSSKIKFDDINQTLDVAFSSLKSTADDTKKKTEANTTAISIAQGEIKTAIENTKIVKDGQTVLLKDEYSKLEQNVGSISSKVSSTETKLNNMKIGGRNLILKSNEPIESSSYLIKEFDLAEDLIIDTEYTFVIKGDVPAGQRFGIWQNGAADNVGFVTNVYSDRVTYVTFKSIAVSGNESKLRLYNYPNNSTTSTIEWVALYKGNKPLDWSPAPEDIDQNISDAIKMETEDGQVVYVKDQVSEINQNLDNITQKVSKVEIEFEEDGSISELKSQVSGLQQTSDKFTMEFFDKIDNADLGVKEIMSYIDFSADGIVLGQKEYPTKLVITKDRIKFIGEDGNELAYFSDNKLLIQDAEILDTLKIANYGFLPNAGGSLTIGTIK